MVAPPPLPPERTRTFDWKPYGKAILWMIPAAVLLVFCSLILGPKIDSTWEESGIQPSKPVLAWMRALVRSGEMAFLAAAGAMVLVLLVSEIFFNERPRFRSLGCWIVSYSTNLWALMALACAAVIPSVTLSVEQSRLDVDQDTALLTGSYSGSKELYTVTGNHIVSPSTHTLDDDEIAALDELPRGMLLNWAITIADKTDSIALKRQSLGQAIRLIEWLPEDRQAHYLKQLLDAAGPLIAPQPDSVTELVEWYESKVDAPGWEPYSISVIDDHVW